MKFYHQDKQGNRRELSQEEVLEHMTPYQIREAIEAKRADPQEEVSYMTVGGFIVVELGTDFSAYEINTLCKQTDLNEAEKATIFFN